MRPHSNSSSHPSRWTLPFLFLLLLLTMHWESTLSFAPIRSFLKPFPLLDQRKGDDLVTWSHSDTTPSDTASASASASISVPHFVNQNNDHKENDNNNNKKNEKDYGSEVWGTAMTSLGKAIVDPLMSPNIEKGVDKKAIQGSAILGATLGMITGAGLVGSVLLGTFGAYAAITPSLSSRKSQSHSQEEEDNGIDDDDKSPNNNKSNTNDTTTDRSNNINNSPKLTIGDVTRSIGSLTYDSTQKALQLYNEFEAGQRVISSTQMFVAASLQVLAKSKSNSRTNSNTEKNSEQEQKQPYESFLTAFREEEERLKNNIGTVASQLTEQETAGSDLSEDQSIRMEEEKETSRVKDFFEHVELEAAAEAKRMEQEAIDEEKQKSEKEETEKEKARVLAQKEAEAARIKAEKEEEEKKARVLAQKEAEAVRVKAEKEEEEKKARVLAQKEAEAARIKAEKEEEEEKARILAQKEAEAARIKAEKEEEEEKARVLAQKEAEAARIKAEKEEEEEKARVLAQKEAEAARIKAEKEEEEEKARINLQRQLKEEKENDELVGPADSDLMQQQPGEDEDAYFARMAELARAAVELQSKFNEDDLGADLAIDDVTDDDIFYDSDDTEGYENSNNDDEFWQASIELAQMLDEDSGIKVDEIIVEKTSDSSAKSELEWLAMTVVQLKDELRSRGLKISGKKAELVKRLIEDDTSS